MAFDMKHGAKFAARRLFVWSAAYGHYHIKEFNQYALLNTPDLPVMPGFMA